MNDPLPFPCVVECSVGALDRVTDILRRHIPEVGFRQVGDFVVVDPQPNFFDQTGSMLHVLALPFDISMVWKIPVRKHKEPVVKSFPWSKRLVRVLKVQARSSR